jgi:hypothetical protein
MSRGGHLLTALAVASSSWALDPTTDRLLLGLGVIAGASLPDQLEGLISIDPAGQRHSMLPHRWITHWPPPWLLLAAIALCRFPAPYSIIVAGLAFGALLHLAIDIGSPSGIPLLAFNRNRSFGDRRPRYRPYVYRTGTREEWRILAPIVLTAALIFATHAQSVQSASEALAASVIAHVP